MMVNAKLIMQMANTEAANINFLFILIIILFFLNPILF